METRDLQVIPLNSSDIIKVTYQSESPQLAAHVLKELGICTSPSTRQSQAQGTSHFFQVTSTAIQDRTGGSEAQLVRFHATNGVVSADFEKQVTLQKVTISISACNKHLRQSRNGEAASHARGGRWSSPLARHHTD